MTRLVTVAFSVLLFGALAAAPAMAQKAAPKGKAKASKPVVVAKVEGEPIYDRDVLAAFRSLPPKVQQQGIDKIYERVLELLIERRMMAIFGRREKYDKKPEVKRRVRQAENQIIRDVYLSQLIKKYLTEERIKAHYDEFVKKNPPKTEVRARHILVENEAKAKDIIKQAKGGQDFAKLAAKNSVGPSAQRGGDLGYFTAKEMVKPFSDVAFKLKKGKISQKPVKTQFGWHVIKVEDRRTRKVPPYAKVKKQMTRQVGQKLGQDFIRQFREQAKVERYSLDGKKKLSKMPATPLRPVPK